jgi:hypothetical protein
MVSSALLDYVAKRMLACLRPGIEIRPSISVTAHLKYKKSVKFIKKDLMIKGTGYRQTRGKARG